MVPFLPLGEARQHFSYSRRHDIRFGFGKQADIATANLVAAMWRLKKLNAQLATPKLNTENDDAEYGKGHEFATQPFKSSGSCR